MSLQKIRTLHISQHIQNLQDCIGEGQLNHIVLSVMVPSTGTDPDDGDYDGGAGGVDQNMRAQTFSANEPFSHSEDVLSKMRNNILKM